MQMCCVCAQSCLTCGHMDGSPPGSSVHGIFQARILKWAVIFSSRGSSPPRDGTHFSSILRHILYRGATWETCATLQEKGKMTLGKAVRPGSVPWTTESDSVGPELGVVSHRGLFPGLEN